MKYEKEIQDKFEFCWLKNDIICFKYKDDVTVELDDVQRMLKIQKNVGVNEATKRIVYAGRYTSITTEAREYIEQHKPKAKAEAFVIHGLAQRILFNFYYKVRRNQNPIRSFKNLTNAIKWVEGF